MAVQTFTIIDSAGIHARPATLLVQAASRFDAEIELEYNGRVVNLKSIMGVMSLGVVHGADIKVKATGSDEQEALDAVREALISNGLAE